MTIFSERRICTTSSLSLLLDLLAQFLAQFRVVGINCNDGTAILEQLGTVGRRDGTDRVLDRRLIRAPVIIASMLSLRPESQNISIYLATLVG